MRIDERNSLVYIQGNVPGGIGSLVKMRDAKKKVDKQFWNLDYPTFLPSDSEITDEVLTWDGGDVDPMEVYLHENDVVSGTAEGGD